MLMGESRNESPIVGERLGAESLPSGISSCSWNRCEATRHLGWSSAPCFHFGERVNRNAGRSETLTRLPPIEKLFSAAADDGARPTRACPPKREKSQAYTDNVTCPQ